MENKLEKKYGLFTAICMVVGIVVGSGVFFKAQVILQKTGGDMPLGVLAWLIGGAIMIVCILAFSAMAQKYGPPFISNLSYLFYVSTCFPVVSNFAHIFNKSP